MHDRPSLYEKVAKLFADEVGLLNLMYEDFMLPPIVPADNLWVAPEAIVEPDGRLRMVDSKTEGLELLLDLLDRQGYISSGRLHHIEHKRKREAARSRVAMPSDIVLLRKIATGPWYDPYRIVLPPVAWGDIRERYGGLLVLDRNTSTRVSVLFTRESMTDWRRVLEDFPSGEYRPTDRGLKRSLNSRLTGVSPYLPEEDEDYRRGWLCSSPLEAMYLMLWLDLTGGHSVRECGLQGCFNYFRVGSQSKTLYCSPKHASLASTRMHRGRIP